MKAVSHTAHMLHEIYRIGKSIEMESGLVVSRGWEDREMGSDSWEMDMRFLLGIVKKF
jgi:hypothetical protein